MSLEIRIPELSESIREVQIGRWLRSEGDRVRKGDAIVELETDKATTELPSPENGRLRILKEAGTIAGIGDAIGEIGVDSEATSRNEGGVRIVEPPTVAEEPNGVAHARAEQPEPNSQDVPKIQSRGMHSDTPQRPPGGLSQSAQPQHAVPLTNVFYQITSQLSDVRGAMQTCFDEVDMFEVLNFCRIHRETFQKIQEAPLSVRTFLARGVALASRSIPAVRNVYHAEQIILEESLGMGVALQAENGLLIPVIRDADQLRFGELARAMADVETRGRNGLLRPDELSAGTIYIEDRSEFDALLSTSIVNAPQSAAIALHAAQDRPAVRRGYVVVRPIAWLSMTYDHRLISTAQAARFLRRVRHYLESPVLALAE